MGSRDFVNWEDSRVGVVSGGARGLICGFVPAWLGVGGCDAVWDTLITAECCEI